MSIPAQPPASRPLYTGLRVRHLDRSIRFYKALGLRQTIRLRTSLGEVAQLEHPKNGFTIELNRFRIGSRVWEPYRPGSEMDHFGFWVDDVDGSVRRLLRAGGRIRWPAEDREITIPPSPPFPGREAMVADPDGIWIELRGPARSKRPGPDRRKA